MNPVLSFYLEIKIETQLPNNASASIDEQGNLLVVQDESLPEEQQSFVYLRAEQARALREFLNQQNVMEVIR